MGIVARSCSAGIGRLQTEVGHKWDCSRHIPEESVTMCSRLNAAA